jgi:hypothetical protein
LIVTDRANIAEVSIRAVGDAAKLAPGDTGKGAQGEPEIVSMGSFKVHRYPGIAAPKGATRVGVEIDLQLFASHGKDMALVAYGFECSVDGGRTWPWHALSTAGDNAVPEGFPPTTSTANELPEDKGQGVLVRAFCGGKAAIDVGVKVVFSWP